MNLYSLAKPILFSLSSETAHEIGLKALKSGLLDNLLPSNLIVENRVERFGLSFKNPFGMAAGFDKNGEVAQQLANLGFGFVEVGTTTFYAQEGNPKPRLFRLPKDYALINRAGFNNDGTAKVVERLKLNRPNCILGMNIGKSKIVPNEEAVEDYLKSFNLVHEIADYIVVNVSSPNTPNLRELQQADALDNLLNALQNRNTELGKKPLLVKIAPDLSESEIEAIVDICLKINLTGIVATNTTISRENLQTEKNEIEKIGNGGLSGKPITKRSTEVISTIYRYSQGKLPIIGVGGIFTPEDAFEKICAGASLLQAYTGFVYQGLTFARDINLGLVKILKEKGFENFDSAVGSSSKQ